MMSKTLADHISSEPLTFSHKHLKWIHSQIVESKGILHAMSIKMGRNKVFLDFHIFDVPKGEEFILIGQPIEPLSTQMETEQLSRSRLARRKSRSA